MEINNKNLKSCVYKEIKEHILDYRILPGEKIEETSWAKKLGVSRTPVRDALSILEKEEIVKIVPKKGAFVRKFTTKEAVDMFCVRETLEGLAARLCAENITNSILNEMKACFSGIKESDIDENPLIVTKTSDRFHLLIRNTSNNQKLKRMMGDINDQIQIFRFYTVILPGRARNSLKEHYAIIDAFEKRDPDMADKMMRIHINNVKNDFLNSLKKSLSVDFPGKPTENVDKESAIACFCLFCI